MNRRESRTLRALALVVLASMIVFGGTVNAGATTVNPYESPRIGVVGCSNTADLLARYAGISAVDNLWYDGINYGGGHIAAWADIENEGVVYWTGFQDNLETFGASAVWVQVCIRENWTSAAGMTPELQDLLTTVIEHIRELTSPSMVIYVSPINSFVVNNCALIGPYGVENGAELADWAASTGLALRGPDIGPLGPEMLASDGCHPKGEGRTLGGQQIAAFFDQVETASGSAAGSPDAYLLWLQGQLGNRWLCSSTLRAGLGTAFLH